MLDRRAVIGMLGMGAFAGTASFAASRQAAAAERAARATRGLPPLKITKVKSILTQPAKARLVVVKVETSEPGLHGLGCATFTQRAQAVAVAVDKFLAEFAPGRDADNIEDMWQTAYTSSYWRNGPVLNNALGGLDMALWDIKGKRAGMPVYQLLGGKCRFAVDTYTRAEADRLEDLPELVQRFMSEGFRHVRIQLGGYGGANISGKADYQDAGFGLPSDKHMPLREYIKAVPRIFEHVRETCGDDVELLHDIHERISPRDAIRLIKDVEPYRPFFIEDPFPPEPNKGYFEQLRRETTVPISMGELFNNPHEWTDLIVERLIDYIRVHISQIGGITPARKLAALSECFGVKTAWHGPPDTSPVGHAANAHLDLAISNFGIQEMSHLDQATRDIFPGAPTFENGYMFVNEAPGLGVDIDEKVAARFPIAEAADNWLPIRRSDGSAVRP
ncbi:MAG: enolase C-terminal domain-like protein [Planctomycetota bacterium]